MDLFYHVFVVAWIVHSRLVWVMDCVAWIVGLISCLVYDMDCLSWFLGCHVVACIVICFLMCVMDCDLLLGVRHGLFIMVSWLPGCYMDCDLSLGVCVCVMDCVSCFLGRCVTCCCIDLICCLV